MADAILRQALSEVQEHIQLGRLQSEALDRTAQHIAALEKRLRVLEQSNARVLEQTGMGLSALTAMREAIRREALHVYGPAALALDLPHQHPCMPPPPERVRAAACARGGSSVPPRAPADAPAGTHLHVQGVLRIGTTKDELAPAAGTKKRPCADSSAVPQRPDKIGPAAKAGELPAVPAAAEACAGVLGRAPPDACLPSTWPQEALHPTRRCGPPADVAPQSAP
eukprot:scaffold15300_cov111-Isochrysis_galbana.AAC.3